MMTETQNAVIKAFLMALNDASCKQSVTLPALFSCRGPQYERSAAGQHEVLLFLEVPAKRKDQGRFFRDKGKVCGST
jgi:hypothetical protein